MPPVCTGSLKSDQDRLLDMLDAWQQGRSDGREPTPEELCPDDERVQALLREHIAAAKALEPVTAAGPAGAREASTNAELPPAPPRYTLLRELGRGGMGVVYAALDTRLERRVAMKVMLPEYAADGNAKERFLREARAAARIKHDNIVTVYEADERDGVPYIAMEFLAGYPLDEYLKKKGNPTIQQVLRVAAEAAAGLAAAHKIGLVHRDIKPGNLWLEAPHGRVKILDFGLAKPLDAEVELTKSGAVVGTPAYMSPEQARGEKVDHRSDLFSLGAMMYRLCTGKLPFNGRTTMAVLTALATEEPSPVRELNPNVPEALSELIHQLLSKPADARPQSAAEVGKRIRAIAEELVAPRESSVEQSTSQPRLMHPQVVYAVLSVAASTGPNPFADLDSPDDERTLRETVVEVPVTHASKPVRTKSGGRWPLVVAGFAALLALVIGGVVIIIKNKDGTETKIEVPDGASVVVIDKNGKTVAQVKPGKKNPPVADTSADRKAAEWVLEQGGEVRVFGVDKDIKVAADLPEEQFNLTTVNLNGNQQVTDAGLECLAGLKSLHDLWLGDTQVTNAGLAHLKNLKSLDSLHLSIPQITDEGLAHLNGFNNLTSLNLAKTKVSGAGLANFRDCAGLTHLYVGGPKMTDEGLVYLKAFKGLTILDLETAPVTDAGLEHIRELRSLTYLSLDRTNVTDAGRVHIEKLRNLETLCLNGTKATDVWLTNLKEFKKLTLLDVRNTKVTTKELEAFHAAVPGCKILHNDGTIEPKK